MPSGLGLGLSAALVVGVLPLAFLWLMVRRPSDRSVAAFARTYGVPLTPHNVDQARRYIQWVRRWRAGATVAVTLGAAAVTAVLERESFAWWLAVAIGYGAGTLVGELARPVERRTDRAAASLEQRRVGHFVSPRLPWVVVGVMAASFVPAVFLLIDNPVRPWNGVVDAPRDAGLRPQDWYVAVLVLASIVASVVAVAGARALARAPMPADTNDRMAARHAIRSAAILSVLAASMVVSGAVTAKLGNTAVLLDGDASTLVQWINSIAGIGGGLASLTALVATFTTIPRLAPLERRLPPVPHAEATQSG